MLSRVKFAIGAALFGATLFLTGCATAARSDAMAASSVVAPVAANAPVALRGNIAIGDVAGGSSTNPLWVSKVGSAEFERAIEASLRGVGMLQPNRQAGNYRLIADLQKVDQPMIGLSFTVTSTVQYSLVERISGRTIFNERISTPFTAGISDAFVGTERLKLANEGSIRVNIERLIERLSSLNISN